MTNAADLPSSDPRRPEGFFEKGAGGIDSERLACGSIKETEPWERLRALAQILLQGEGADELTDMIFGAEDETLERKLLRKDWQHHKGTWRTGHQDRPLMNPADRQRYEREGRTTSKGHPPMSLIIARKVREDRANGMGYGALAEKYGISTGVARSIVNHRSWREDDHAA